VADLRVALPGRELVTIEAQLKLALRENPLATTELKIATNPGGRFPIG